MCKLPHTYTGAPARSRNTLNKRPQRNPQRDDEKNINEMALIVLAMFMINMSFRCGSARTRCINALTQNDFELCSSNCWG